MNGISMRWLAHKMRASMRVAMGEAVVDGGHGKRYDCVQCIAFGGCAHTLQEFEIE